MGFSRSSEKRVTGSAPIPSLLTPAQRLQPPAAWPQPLGYLIQEVLQAAGLQGEPATRSGQVELRRARASLEMLWLGRLKALTRQRMFLQGGRWGEQMP